MKWEQITLKQYQAIDLIDSNSEYDSLDKAMHTACVLFGYTENTFSELRVKKAARLIRKVGKCFERPFPEKVYDQIGMYQLNYNMSQLRLGQYVELTHFLQGKTIENAPQILASIAHLPGFPNNSDDHVTISEYFLDQPVVKIIGSVSYLIYLFGDLNKRYKGLFDLDDEREQGKADPFNEQFGWIYSVTIIAEHERITLDEAYNLNIIQGLNDLAYLKAKRQYDEKILKEHGKFNQ